MNLPYEATVEDIADGYVQAWHCGVKALATTRDGSKTAQALRPMPPGQGRGIGRGRSGRDGLSAGQVDDGRRGRRGRATQALASVGPKRTACRAARVDHAQVSIAGDEGYITADIYEDGTLGEIFLTDIGKEGSTLRGLLNSFATSISMALQYGVPLEKLVEKFSYMRFEPEGITQNPEIPFAKSMPDYIMRWLASRFLDTDIQEELGIMTPEVRARKMAEELGDVLSLLGHLGFRQARRRRRAPQAVRSVRSRPHPAGDDPRGRRGDDRHPTGRPGPHARPGPRPGMRPVRRHDAAHGLLLHLLELRQQHRLRVFPRHSS